MLCTDALVLSNTDAIVLSVGRPPSRSVNIWRTTNKRLSYTVQVFVSPDESHSLNSAHFNFNFQFVEIDQIDTSLLSQLRLHLSMQASISVEDFLVHIRHEVYIDRIYKIYFTGVCKGGGFV